MLAVGDPGRILSPFHGIFTGRRSLHMYSSWHVRVVALVVLLYSVPRRTSQARRQWTTLKSTAEAVAQPAGDESPWSWMLHD